MADFNRNNRSGGGRDKRFGGRDSGRRGFGNNNFGGGRDRGDFGRPAMFRAVCDNCGKSCEVPFKPSGEKPVYCSDCFENMGNTREDSRGDNRNSDRPSYEDRQMFSAICDNCGNECKLPFKPTAGKPVYCSNCFDKQKSVGFNKGGRDQDRSSGGNSDLTKQLEALNSKLDRILNALEPKSVPELQAKIQPEAKAELAPKKKSVKKEAKVKKPAKPKKDVKKAKKA